MLLEISHASANFTLLAAARMPKSNVFCHWSGRESRSIQYAKEIHCARGLCAHNGSSQPPGDTSNQFDRLLMTLPQEIMASGQRNQKPSGMEW
ncbi:hypothetical protein BAUCODRAFT_305510 [Baudoinia panamericana UAMH 10762]|uniref:Uncharacterized protein n=1 Tax=Baudoinia panamericana (strain UAMH 10762) TaxID=717646 RepID=M2MKE9_BAUPA|nr:uncharacterized protein BAUCODRAFT_305510 [Baudoinia panamericana UAMH 10762]EMC91803.1 hypothetical protein BAUCODRAFT_305510 [Baudoinia panamericana UAMH 10762]